MRTRYRWNPETQRQEPIAQSEGMSFGLVIMPDIPDFVSPVDGSVVHGRRGLREHNKRNNVTNAADFTDQWKRQAQERAKLFTPGAGFDAKRRKEALIRAYDQLSTRRRK